jgi:hypothetical protein
MGGTAVAQLGDEQPIRRGKRHLMPLLELSHHGLRQRRPELEPMSFHTESLWRHGMARAAASLSAIRPNRT